MRNIVSIFSGCGGLDLGFKAGFNNFSDIWDKDETLKHNPLSEL